MPCRSGEEQPKDYEANCPSDISLTTKKGRSRWGKRKRKEGGAGEKENAEEVIQTRK